MNKRVFRGRCFIGVQKTLSFLLICLFIFSDVSTFLKWPLFYLVEAAQVQVDATVSTAQLEHNFSGSQSVFISDQVGYKFYVDSTGVCVYSKTTNGGTSWGAAVTIDAATTCFGVAVWYDRWTSGDTGTNIHILTHDTTADDLWYNRLDTTSDTRLLGTTPVSAVSNSGQAGTFAAGGNTGSITKGTDGTLYMAMSDNSDSYVVECSSNCGTATSWTETGTNPMDLQPDFPLLMPLAGGNILLINRDISADDLRSKVWDNTSGTWSATWNIFNANTPENTTYDPGMSAVVNKKTGDVYLSYVDNGTTGTIGGNDDNLRTAVYSAGSWTNKTNVVTNTAEGLTSVAMTMDENTSNVYIAYTSRSTPATATTANVYWASSTSAMSAWSSRVGPVNTTADDLYGVDLNGYNDERIYVTWYGITPDDIFGDTIADIAPFTVVSATGTQVSQIRASTTNFYVGGKFSIKENISSRNVTTITVSENGTVDAATGLNNIKLLYDLDTSAPYDCASESYSGAETQYGTTDTNGFSGTDGVSSFTGSVAISPTQAMCVYVVLDVLKAAANGSTLEVYIDNPSLDVLVSGGVTSVPTTAQNITGATNIVDSVLTQTHYHWRYDDGSETTATSRTSGVEDTPLNALLQNTPRRLRFGVSNNGSTTSLPTTLRLEYASATSACSGAAGWTDVGATDDAFNMYDSAFVTDGANTTDISNTIGGVTNVNTVFLTPNGGQRDTNSSLGPLTFLTTNWTEVEFSIIASTTAVEGTTYCFRLTDAGTPLPTYTNYAKATIAADVTVRATSTQVATADVPTSNFYTGGKFTISENDSSRNVTSVTIKENGTIDASTGLSAVRLYYDLDTSAPYDCASESYSGSESQFGAATVFNGIDGSAVFTGSVGISLTSTMCIYPVMNITSVARNGETIDITIDSGSGDVSVSGGGSVSPSTALDIASSTQLRGGVVTQTHYHWRNDDGSESAATSATGGSEDTELLDFGKSAPIRLRVGLSNEGATTSVPHKYGLEYGIKISTCSAVSVWTDVDGGGISWSMKDSPNLTNGDPTTDIPVGTGGVGDPGGKTFLTSNAGVLDTTSFSATTTLTETQYVELEYSIQSTVDTPYKTTFCFRTTQDGVPLLQYDKYAEVTTQPKRDFKVQRGTSVISGNTLTLTAGTDYVAPSASTSAFVRITNMYSVGAGRSTGGNTQNADDVTAYILDPSNIVTSFTLARTTGASFDTQVSWEIVEYVGSPGGDNETKVRGQKTISFGSSDSTMTDSVNTSVVDDSKVVVFITGIGNQSTNASQYYAGQITSRWDSGTHQPIFERIGTGSAVDVSYAIVEFTGVNWKIQRVEHQYQDPTVIETESVAAVNSITHTFLHTQKRMGALAEQDHFGHEVWLSSIGTISFQLESTAATSSGQVSVAWVIENTQVTTGEMIVQQSNGIITAGSEPRTTVITLGLGIDALNNTSIFSMSRLDQNTTNFPRVLGSVTLTSTSTYEIWNSDRLSATNFRYRTEVVEWPVADLTVRQNYYRFYVDNNSLKPTDPWPVGVIDLGENTSITTLDEPLADGQKIRIRMTARANNATLPAGILAIKLQYGVRSTSCSAISSWFDVGSIASGEIWRGYDANSVSDGLSLSGNPPTSGDLLISVSDKAGRYTEQNPAVANAFAVPDGDDIEYDWIVEQNGAAQRTVYCFRMIKVDNTSLDGYLNYPQLRTESYAPVTQNWRWYDDELSETPLTALANENVAPVDVKKGNTIKLRVTVNEIKNLSQINARFKLQFSTSPVFSNPQDVVAVGDCNDNSVWCYADGAGIDNATITTKTLSDSDACTSGIGSGCGTHNESQDMITGFTHSAGTAIENEFTIKYTNILRNFGRVYYFRLYDVANDLEVPVNTSYSYPSVVGESASLSFTFSGVSSSTITEGVTTDISTTPTTIEFGELPFNSELEAAQRITVNTNATNGYTVYLFANQDLLDSYGNSIPNIISNNSNPISWSSGCAAQINGCFGYHSGDDSLNGGSTRFAPDNTYAAIATTTPEEVMFSSQPAVLESTDIIYKIQVSESQPAGLYENELTFLTIPIF